jgi:hypothetical protein
MLLAALALDVTLVAGGLPSAAGVAVDPQGTPFVSAGSKVFRVFGRNTVQPFVDTGGRPAGLAFDAAGDLWVADAGRQALLRVKPWGEVRVAARGYPSAAQLAKAAGAATEVRDERGNRYLCRGAQVQVVSPDGNLIASHVAPGSEVTGLAFGGVDLKTLYVTERETGALYKLRVPHRSQRLPWEPDYPLRITDPPGGAILNRHDGERTPRGLRIAVEGVCDGPVRVNGAPAEVRDGRFRASVVLAARENRITAEGGGRKHRIRVFWDRASLPRYRFSVDDNIWFLRDLAQNAPRYQSIFDNPYLAFWREMHRQYGARIHFNIYWETEGFNLSQMPAKYRDEWRRNADWIRLTFHARANDPARPYLESTAERIRRDYRLVTREIARFAGKEVMSNFTTIHWGTTTLAAARALRREGVFGLAGYFEARDELPTVCYYLPLAQWTYLAGRDYWKDTAEDLIFVRHDLVVNSFKLEEIVPRLEKLAADPHQSEVLELMIHEQYFYPHYVAYQPDFRQKVERAIQWVTRRGYRPVFFEEGFLGAPRQ